MQKLFFPLVLLCFLHNTQAQTKLPPPLEHASLQFKLAFKAIAEAKAKNPTLVSPRSLREDTLFMVPSRDWTSGFFPGNLWYLYELTGDAFWQEKAREFTANLEREKTNGTTHDMGFKMYCSYGNGYRLTKDAAYRDILIESARTLCTRFHPKIAASG